MRYPSTTQILAAHGFYDGYPALDPQRQQDIYDRGILVHKACHNLALERPLKWKEPHPELDGYLDGYRLFLREHNFKLLEWETEWTCQTIGFISHPDQIGDLYERPSIVELKTGKYNGPATQLQTAGQCVAIETNRRGRVWLRYCLHLPGDGSYHLIPHREERDKAEFIALVQAAHVAMKYDLPLGRRLKQIMEERSRD